MIDMRVPRPDWWPQARCITNPPPDLRIFFPPQGHGGLDMEGIAFCAGCPVRAECLAYALEKREKYGTWGGVPEKDRRAMLRRMREGRQPPRPKKTDRASAKELRAMLASGMSRQQAARAGRTRMCSVIQAEDVLVKVRKAAEGYAKGLTPDQISDYARIDRKWVTFYLAEASELRMIAGEVAAS